MYKKIIISALAGTLLFNVAQAQGRPERRPHHTDEYKNEYEAKKRALKELQDKMDREKKEADKLVMAGYGRNFVRLTPIKFLDLSAVGIGLEYEHLFGKDKMFGLSIPVTIMFKQSGVPDIYGNTSDMKYSPYFFINPGLKVYPMGQRKVSYAVGPSFMFGYGIEKEWQVLSGPVNSYTKYIERNNLRLGLIIMNYLNFQFTRNFSMSIDAGIGIRYLNHYTNPKVNDDIIPTGQFSLGFGYRF